MKNIPDSLFNPPHTLDRDSSVPFVELENYRFHYRVYGRQHRDVVLVVHGGPGGDFQYLLPVKALANEYQVVFFDQRGTGLSPRTEPSRLSLEQYLRDLDAFVDHFKKEHKIHILGHSWGGYLALQYVARHPAKVDKVVLAAPFIPDLRTKIRYVAHNVRHGILFKLAWAKWKSFGVPLLDRQAQNDFFFGVLLRSANPGYLCRGKESSIPIRRAGYLSYINLSNDQRGAKRLGEVRFPPERVMIIAGECDRLLGIKYQRRVCRKLQDPELMEVSAAGHYLFQDNAQDCLQLIRAFLS